MRRLFTGLLAMALVLGLLAVEPLEAKVYKMKPEERAAALKEKKAKRTKAKKTGKAAPGQDQGGWVEVKPGEKIATKKNRKSKVDEIAKAAEDKGKKSKKSKKGQDEAAAEKPQKKSKKSKKESSEAAADKPEQAEKKGKKSKKDGAEEIVVEKKGRKSKAALKAEKDADQQIEKTSSRKSKKSSRKSAAQGDRAVGSSFSGERKVSASSAEVHRTGVVPAPAAPAAGAATKQGEDLSSYSVSRPGQEKAAVVPEVRHEVQSGPLDTSKPIGTEHKSGEGRF